MKGRLPPDDLGLLQQLVANNTYMPFGRLIAMDQKTWNTVYEQRLYTQSWSMVYFLMHADGGKYRPYLEDYLSKVSKATQNQRDSAEAGRKMWEEVFGNDMVAFENRWKQWVRGLSERDNLPIARQANVRTILAYMDRGIMAKVPFNNVGQFVGLASTGRIPIPDDQVSWIPPEILHSALGQMDRNARWELTAENNRPVLTVIYPDGMGIRAKYADDSKFKITTSEILGQAPVPTRQGVATTAPANRGSVRSGSPGRAAGR